MNPKFLLGLVFLQVFAAEAAGISGKVISIADGDTLTLLTHERQQIKVRLAAIDAPEKAQSFGQRSRQSLANLCFQKHAKVKLVDIDRYGRTVGLVECEGTHANRTQVQTGMAWVYRKYAKGFTELFPLEQSARDGKQGLWAEPNPIPPWEWRKKR